MSGYDLRRIPIGAYVDMRMDIPPQHQVVQLYEWIGQGWRGIEYQLQPLGRNPQPPFWLEVEFDEEWVIHRWSAVELTIEITQGKPHRTLEYEGQQFRISEEGQANVIHVTTEGRENKGDPRYFDYFCQELPGTFLCVEIFPDSSPEVFLGHDVRYSDVTAYGTTTVEPSRPNHMRTIIIVIVVICVAIALVVLLRST